MIAVLRVNVMRVLYRLLLPLMLLLAGCREDGPSSLRERQELRAARTRWLANSVRVAYRFEVRQSCFCPPDVERWHTVTVINDVITDVRNTESGVIIPPARRSTSVLARCRRHAPTV